MQQLSHISTQLVPTSEPVSTATIVVLSLIGGTALCVLLLAVRGALRLSRTVSLPGMLEAQGYDPLGAARSQLTPRSQQQPY